MARTFALELALNLQQFRKGMSEVATGLANGVKAGAAGLASSLKPAADGVREIGAAAKEAQVAMLALSGAAAMGLRSMIKNAAEDETAARRFATAYGDAADEAQRFAEQIASGSRRGVGEIQSLMAEFQDFAVAQGAAREDAAKLSQELTARAVDLAGYYGRDVKETMNALQQAMVGSGRAARVFGVDMDETAIKAKALSMGFNPSTLQPWQEAMIRSNLILDQTKDKAGKAGAQAGTFTEELRAMATQFGELMSDLGTPVIDALKPVMTELGNIIKGFREWINEHPALKTALGLVTAATLTFVGACALAATVLSPLWSLLRAGYTILATYAAQLKAAALAQTQFTLTANATTLTMTRLGAAVSIVGAAFIGWHAGTQIAEWLGLAEATDRLADSTATLGDKAKVALTFLATGPAGWVAGAFYAKAIAESQYYLEEQKKHVAEINALADARIAKMTEEQQAMAKQLELWGFTHVQASILAGDEMKLLKALEAQVKAGKGNAVILELIEKLRRRNADALDEEAAAMVRNKSEAEKLQEAKERLKKGEEEFLKMVEEIGQEVLRAREGEAAVEAATLKKQLEKRLADLEAHARAELVVMRDLEQQKTALQAKAGDPAGKDREELKRLEEEYRKHAANLNTARQTILNAEEAYNLKLRGVYQKRLDDLRGQKAKEIQEVKDSTQKLVDTYEKAVNDIDAKLDRLRSKREAGEATATDFIREYERKALREHDARQLELQDLEAAANQALMGAQNEGQRAKVVEIAAKEAKKLVDQSERAAELEREIADLKGRQRSARSEEDSDPQQIAKLTQEITAKETELANERKLQAELQKQYEEVLKRLGEKWEESQEAAKMDGAELDRLEWQRKTYQDAILESKEKELAATRLIEESYKAQVGHVEKLISLIGKKPKEATAAIEGVAATPSAGEAETAVTKATAAAQESAAAAQAVQTAAAQAATAAQTMAQTIQTQLEPLRADLANFIKWAAGFAADVSKLMPQVLQSIGMVLEEQRAFGASLMQFGNVTLEKLTEAQTAFALHRTELDALSAEIGALKLLESARGDAGLGAQGY